MAVNIAKNPHHRPHHRLHHRPHHRPHHRQNLDVMTNVIETEIVKEIWFAKRLTELSAVLTLIVLKKETVFVQLDVDIAKLLMKIGMKLLIFQQ